MAVTVSEIEDELALIVGRWRSQTSTEQRNDLSYLDDLLGNSTTSTRALAGFTAELVDGLRGRVEILMDEIKISFGIKPVPIPGLADMDIHLGEEEPYEGE